MNTCRKRLPSTAARFRSANRESEMDKLRTALIGCGPRGVEGHGHKLKESDRFDLVAVCDLDEALAANTAEALGCEAVTDYKKLLRRTSIEAVVIVTATEFHSKLALRAVKAGKHVLLEKPLTHDLASAVALLQAAKEAGVKGMVCYQLRFHPFYEALKQQAAQIMPVQLYSSRQCGLMGRKYLQAGAQGGLLDFCSHDFDVALWLMGVKPKRVFATLGQGIYTDTNAVDLLSVQIEFGPDPLRAAHVVSSMGGMGIPRRYDLVGRHGNVTAQGQGLKRTTLSIGETGRSTSDSVEIAVDPGGPDPTHLLHEHFADYIRDTTGKFPAKATLRDGVNSLLIAEAALESSRNKTVVELDELAARHGYALGG
ncbi:MAG: hypothetical protein COZ06_10820 [Armatimonadetes bacterium CG_4_10_14_3_um_filter_66_18]|nr:MAG: hypothetical protein COZ57_26445 [Armatimonadetes bacterium CG_4_8_14_3_um_filter_66_20]PIY50176.1 MAG: hypothetical protein COZ06_10820 [Armatimonadetes bacterium CG_4_10_14_3_um_filter_66_18]PIZ30210.1 MAG: hypothetical protein COY42_34405 [Armatimonadetes bacterium CG_4_10_14_0_8_um_filter_66_14]PJB73155.1 MAG: hypothetical protein CO096_06360 [Armatimonadetes bacterium CG_4_9_14_3_um_filter_66_14]